MDQTTLKIAIAGFMHDIGKFADKVLLGVSDEFVRNHADLYQPCFDGRYSHPHAVYTAAFIEQMKDYLPAVFNRPGWGEGDAFINLAAGHHRPETPLQWIIAMADRLSSGWDRVSFEAYNQQIQPRDYRKTRLAALFERLTLEREREKRTETKPRFCYPLESLSPTSIFPRSRSEVVPEDDQKAQDEYRDLFKVFVAGLKDLLHRDESIELWFEHFDSLMMACTAAIPAARAGGEVNPDVSLYDHSRATSALASALYRYHSETGTLDVKSIGSYEESKFLVVGGDFYGIQDFIFTSDGDVRKHRSKLLRGRSLLVSLFSELAADRLCRTLGLPFSSVLLSAAGKFTIIAPNTPLARDGLARVEAEVNDWLTRITLGQSTLGLATVKASPSEFVKGRFIGLWDRLQDGLQRRKSRRIDLARYAGPVSNYLDSFDNSLNPPLCPLCGKRPSKKGVAASRYLSGDLKAACATCRDHVFLGSDVVKKARLAIRPSSVAAPDPENCLYEPVFGFYQVGLYDRGERLDRQAGRGELLRYWDLSIDPDRGAMSDIATKFINGYVPIITDMERDDLRLRRVRERETGGETRTGESRVDEVKTFGEIAAKALNLIDDGKPPQGVEALGVLKADVDNLGLLLSCGLPDELFTLSRLATLSRQINFFFSIYLPHLLQTDHRFTDTYTVFAGGDDLFLIGPWNRVIELAGHVHTRFSEYVCRNPQITLSAGIHFTRPHVPVDRIAEAGEYALERAKESGKDRITLFGETVTWSEFAQLITVGKTIRQWFHDDMVNKAMLYRLNELIDNAEKESRLVRENEIQLADMECTKWRARLAYSTERNAAKPLKGEKRQEAVNQVHANLAKWLLTYRGALRIPLWQLLYNMR